MSSTIEWDDSAFKVSLATLMGPLDCHDLGTT